MVLKSKLNADDPVVLRGNLGTRNHPDTPDIGYRERDTSGIEALHHHTCNSFTVRDVASQCVFYAGGMSLP